MNTALYVYFACMREKLKLTKQVLIIE